MSRPAAFKLRLFVAGDSQNSTRAVVNLRRLCDDHLAGRHTLEMVDVLREPDKALAARVFMTPTLVRLAPAPDVRIVGTLSQTSTVLRALGLQDCAA